MKKLGREFLRSRAFRIGVLGCLVLSMMVCTASAAEGSSSTSATIVSAFTTGFQQIASDALSMIAAAAPVALSIAGAIFLAKKAISWFKGMAK